MFVQKFKCPRRRGPPVFIILAWSLTTNYNLTNYGGTIMNTQNEQIAFDEEMGCFMGMNSCEQYWPALYVCEILGFTDVEQAMAELDPDEKAYQTIESDSGEIQEPEWFVSDSGLINLLMLSKEPVAKTFKRWVSHDLMPGELRPFMMIHEDRTTIKKDLEDLGILPCWAF